METNEVKEYRLLQLRQEEITDNGTRRGTLEMLKADFPDPEWAIIPVDKVPGNWQDMNIENGELVPASAELIETRRTARLEQEVETVRAARESRYRAETDAMMLDAIEAYAAAHPEDQAFAAWLAAKNKIREELPKPTEK